MTTKNVNRRDFIKYLAGGVVGIGIGGAGYLSNRSKIAPLEQELEQLKQEKGAIGYVFGAEGSIATIDLALGKLLASSQASWIAEAGRVDWANHYPDKDGNIWGLGRAGGKATVYEVNPSTNEKLTEIPLEGRWRFALAETDVDGKYGYFLNLLVANKFSDEQFNAAREEFEIPFSDVDPSVIYKVDLQSGELVGELPVPKFCCDVAIGPDNKLWTTNQLESLLTVIDTNSFTVEEHLGTEYTDWGGSMITISPNNDLAFIEVNSAGNWSNVGGFKNTDAEEMVWDIKAKEVVKRFPLVETPPRTSEFTPDGRYVLVRTGPASIVYDTESLEEVTKIEIENSGHPAFSPDSSLAYVPNGGNSSIDVFEVGSFKKLDSIALPQSPAKIVPVDLKQF